MTANCDKNLNVLKYTDFPTQNGLIYTDFFLNILRTQNTALGTVMRGGAAPCLGLVFSFDLNMIGKQNSKLHFLSLLKPSLSLT